MLAGSNSWDANHQALNEGLNVSDLCHYIMCSRLRCEVKSQDMWALDNTPTSMAHFTRGNLPVHFGIVDAFTSADMCKSFYHLRAQVTEVLTLSPLDQESVIASTVSNIQHPYRT